MSHSSASTDDVAVKHDDDDDDDDDEEEEEEEDDSRCSLRVRVSVSYRTLLRTSISMKLTRQ